MTTNFRAETFSVDFPYLLQFLGKRKGALHVPNINYADKQIVT